MTFNQTASQKPGNPLGLLEKPTRATDDRQESRLQSSAVALLGPNIEHKDSLTAMLAGRVRHLRWLPDSLCFRQKLGLGTISRFRRLRDQLWGTSDPAYLDEVLRSIDENGTRVLIAYWGTIPLPDLRALKQARPHLKIVLMLLCYPLALSSWGIARQNYCLRRAASFIDGVIFPSGGMEQYVAGPILPRSVARVVIPPCWPAEFQKPSRPQFLKTAPNVVFAGRTDLTGNTVHAADDVRPLMQSILDAGIELHHAASPETDDGHPLRKLFQSVSLREMIEVMGKFDASLVAYNTEACARDDRFGLTVPDRLITSVTAGIPIALPARGYEAAKAYLREYPAVIEFVSAHDLRDTLADRPRVEQLRNAAWAARPSYAAERHGDDLAAFLETLI